MDTGRGIFAVTVPATAAGNTVVPITAPHRLCGWSLLATAAAGLQATGIVTGPTAGQQICSVGMAPLGEYTVNWTVHLSGTITAAEQNNVGLYVGGTLKNTGIIDAAAGDYPQDPVQILTTPGSLTVQLKAIALGGAAAVYDANLTLVGGPASQATILDGTQVQGVTGPLATSSDTQWLTDEGIFVAVSTAIQVNQGTVSGCVYIRTFDEPT